MSKKGGYKHVPDTKSSLFDYQAWTMEYFKPSMTVTEWVNSREISNDDILAYPNARTAYEIRTSPLYKALL